MPDDNTHRSTWAGDPDPKPRKLWLDLTDAQFLHLQHWSAQEGITRHDGAAVLVIRGLAAIKEGYAGA